MGVRFECPRGHKLHVKAELAGRRAICPECGVKFIVPSFSGGQVAEDGGSSVTPPPVKGAAKGGTSDSSGDDESGVAETSQSIIISTVPSRTPPPAGAPPTVGPAAEAVAWFVRPQSGGQFGPAPTDVFREWIASGRVAADSWVWRTGWTDWRPGVEALAALETAAAPPVAGTAPELKLDHFAPPAAASEPTRHETTSAETRRAEMRRRKQRNRAIALVLGVVALVVAIVMAVVLNR